MISIEFTEEAIKQLFKERYEHPHPRVQQRLEALYLKSQGIAHGKICQIKARDLCEVFFKIYRYVLSENGSCSWKGRSSQARRI